MSQLGKEYRAVSAKNANELQIELNKLASEGYELVTLALNSNGQIVAVSAKTVGR